MSLRATVILCAQLLAAAAAAAPGPAPIPGSRVVLAPPPGFAPSSSFAGFVDEAGHASITVLDFPAPAFTDFVTGMTTEALTVRGLKVARNERRRIDGHDAMWIEGEQPVQGSRVAKWLVIVAAPAATAMVTVNQPVAGLSPERRSAIEAALQSIAVTAQPIVAPRDALPYQVTEVSPFVFSRALMGAGMMFEDRADHSARRADLFVGHSLGSSRVQAGQEEQFALTLLQGIDTIVEPAIESSRPVEQDGLAGLELAATAKDRTSGAPLTIYQTILFDGDRYFRLVGTTTRAAADANLPKFRQMLASFHRR